MRRTILLGVLALSGCVSESFLRQQLAQQNQAILTIGRKVVEHEARLYPSESQYLKDGLSQNELRLTPKEIQ